MPVNRIARQLNLKKSDSIILIYGLVSDIFVKDDLTIFDTDGIEKILCDFLKKDNFEQIIFYSPGRQLYAYDEQSYNLCYPTKEKQSRVEDTGSDKSQTRVDGRPLGTRKILRANTRSTNPLNERKVVWNTLEGFIPIVKGQGGDAAIMDIMRATIFQKKHKSAVIFSQFDNIDAISEIQRLFRSLIAPVAKNSTKNKLIFIINTSDLEKLNQIVVSIPILGEVISKGTSGKGLASLLCITTPQKDEIRNLLNRHRILYGKGIDWQQLDRMVVGISRAQDELKRWHRELEDIEQINIPSINAFLKEPLGDSNTSALQKLEGLVGLETTKVAIKRHLKQILAMRKNAPGHAPLMHMVLKGNPGTGKTTIARLIAEILQEQNLLESGHLIEVDRVEMVGEYVGQTAPKTSDCCRRALGGVLFIDEAYSLIKEGSDRNSSNDFGREAVDTLIKRMSDWQRDFCVILAGYPEDMDRLLASNPGFKRRIGQTIVINDYSPEELFLLFVRKIALFKRSMSAEFEAAIKNIFKSLHAKRGNKFENAGVVDRIFGEINGMYEDRCDRDTRNEVEEHYRIEDIPYEYKKDIAFSSSSDEEDPTKKLNELVGLEKAKKQIKRQLTLATAGLENEYYVSDRRLHMIFSGNPGTGKTTVAKLVGEIYQRYNILSSNVFVKAIRKDLIGTHQGDTEKKVEAKCKEARGGILFIDEAYTLVKNETDTYGMDAVNTLLDIMEEQREDLCVIVAGYPDKMLDFINTNPGLSRRFVNKIEFEDYNADELFTIFSNNMLKKSITISDEVSECVKKILSALYERRNENFGNAGEVEILIQKILECHAERCSLGELKLNDTPITVNDIPDDYKLLLSVTNPDEIIEEALAELNGLVGLKKVKEHVNNLVNKYKHDLRRLIANPNVPIPKRSHHLVFKGKPGTGKTTVARIMGKIFRALDILKEGEVKEVVRMDFVARYSGHTAAQTTKLIKSTFDNVLFIDEAYSLYNGEGDTFGKEAVDVLVALMENHRDRLVVIAAGYLNEMEDFMNVNPGLPSRFPDENQLVFEDFTAEEMVDIFKSIVIKSGYTLQEGIEEKIAAYLGGYKERKGTNFGNGRDVRNFFEAIVQPRYLDRVSTLDIKDTKYLEITLEDFPDLYNAENKKKAHKVDKRPFSPKPERLEYYKAANYYNNGSGDVVMGNKMINYYGYGDGIREIPKLLTALPERDMATIFGRDEVVEKMHSHLFNSNHSNKLLLWGIPGVGKTKTVIKFLDTYIATFEHVIWLDTNTGFKKSLIENKLLLENLRIEFAQNENDDSRYAKIISRLSSVSKTSLLVIENLTNNDAGEFKTLTLNSFIIIATARQQMEGGYPLMLEPLEPQTAELLFRSVFKGQVEEGMLESLLAPVSYHPLAVDILAKILATNPNITVERMLQDIDGLHISKIGVDTKYSVVNEEHELIRFFDTLFGLANLNEEEGQILLYFSVLPSQPISRHLLSDILLLDTNEKKDRFNLLINSLAKKGFIIIDSTRGVFCNQIIRQVIRSTYKPSIENCAILFDTLGAGLYDNKVAPASHMALHALAGDYRDILETFVTYFNEEDLFFKSVYANLTAFFVINGHFRQSADIAYKAKSITEPIKDKSPLLYSRAVRMYAKANAYLGDYELAEQAYLELVTFLGEINIDKHEEKYFIEIELSISYTQLGLLGLKAHKNNAEKSVEYFEKGLSLIKTSDDEASLSQWTLREGLAMAQIDNGQFDDAIDNLKFCKRHFIALNELEKNSMGISMYNIWLALAYSGKNIFSEAHRYAASGLESFKKNLPEDNFELYRAYFISAMVNMQDGLNRMDIGEDEYLELFEAAAMHFEKAIEVLLHHRPEDHDDLALLYCNYGLVLLFTGKEDKGMELHKKGLSIFKRVRHKSDVIAGVFLRAVLFFKDIVTETEADEAIASCLHFLANDSGIDRAHIYYSYGVFKHQKGKTRDGISDLNIALNDIRAFFGKDINEDPDTDSPWEVVCMLDIAEMHSTLNEHRSAIDWQEEAVRICERHIEPNDEDMAYVYLRTAKIYFNTAVANNDKKKFADALKYKTLVRNIIPASNEDLLNDIGELYLINTKGENPKQYYIIVPTLFLKLLEEDFRDNNINDPEKYGYVLQQKNNMGNIDKTTEYTKLYGIPNMQFA